MAGKVVVVVGVHAWLCESGPCIQPKVETEPAGLASVTSLGDPMGKGHGRCGGLHGAAHWGVGSE